MKSLFFLSLFTLSISFPSLGQGLPSAIAKALNTVDTNNIRSHISFLADDKLKGRLPGTEGYRMAMDYVVSQFEKTGLVPAGDRNSYLQEVNLRKAILDMSSFAAAWKDINGNTLVFTKNDLQVTPHPFRKSVSLTAPLVFAGYGVDIPGQYSDYDGIDARGKIVVVLRGAPPLIPSTLAAHFNSTGYKIGQACRNGAAGIIIASATGTSSPLITTVPSLTVALDPAKTKAYGSGSTGLLDLVANASVNTLNFLFTAAEKNLDKTLAELNDGHPRSFQFTDSLSVNYLSIHQDFTSYNVSGKIEGTDPVLRNEYVLHTAHLDHTGVGKPVDGDSIYNGAHDNASGVASLLEIGRLYKSPGVKIRRSVLIVMVTGEEMGLLGSAYFAANPTVPGSSIVANINSDMPTVIAPLLSIVPLGSEHSSLVKNVEFAASSLGLDIEKDPEPSENRFVRSDQYSFIMRGIPALHIKYGNKTNVPGFNLGAYIKDWREKYYHKPADGMEGIFNFAAAGKYVQLNFLVSYSIATSKEKPTMNKGSLFGLKVDGCK